MFICLHSICITALQTSIFIAPLWNRGPILDLPETWYTSGNWVDVSCIIRIRLTLLICPFISSFFFLFRSQTLKIFVTLFSGTVRPTKFKLGTHMNNGWMYHVYRNQGTAAYSSLCFFIFLSLQFLNIENFRHTFRRNCEAFKVETWYNVDNGWMYSVYRNQAAAAYLSLYFFIFLSLQFSNIKIFITLFPSHFPITLFPKLGAHMLNEPM